MNDTKRPGVVALVIALALAVFIITEAVFVTLISVQASNQIDRIQNEIYSQKMKYAIKIVSNRNQRLGLTENIPVYEAGFKESAIREILSSLVENEDSRVKLYIFNGNGRAVLAEEQGSAAKDHASILDDLEKSSENRSGNTRELKSLTVGGIKSWVVNAYFEPWDWHLYFVVPYSVKYAGLNSLRVNIIVSGTIMFVLVLAVVALLLIKSLQPLLKLTRQAINMSSGDMETPVNLEGFREIRLLSVSFESLRISMKDKIERLKKEIANGEKSREDMEKLLGELKISNEDLHQFAYASSHDLKEPLRNIANAAGMFEKKFGSSLPKDAVLYLKDIIDNIKKMDDLIKGILDYSVSGRVARTTEPVKVKEVINEIREILNRSVSKSFDIILETRLPDLHIDRTAVMRIFSNLIANGIKYNKNDTAEIRIGCKPDNGKYLFYVSDNGIGIPGKYSEKVFEVFQRLHSSFEYDGSGIGLAICKKIIDRVGGRIWVESEGVDGKGSIFYFTL